MQPKALSTTTSFDELSDVAQSLGQAFCFSPAYRYIFKDLDDYKRCEAISWMLHRNIYLHLAEDSCFALRKSDLPDDLKAKCQTISDNTIVCYFMLIDRRHRKPVSFFEMITNGLLLLPFYYGFSSATRLLEVMAYNDGESNAQWNLSKANNNTATYYLHNMIVHPALQGCGIGGACLTAGLDRLRLRHPDVPVRVTLSTQEERNVRFYHRLGFEVVREGQCRNTTTNEVNYHNWLMEMKL
eukprot:TRINITY_DN451_c0_g1_i1.p1 TRINITY_DN451_c0_g1~~TRINITY_DN451_c0_g1_i1.p1  ORF type:complete len:269 (+),score=54.38 TRINITY_DN451_c0_g1_i1:87-809(+)